MHVARSKHFLPPLSLYRVMLMVPVRKHSAGRQKFPNRHRPHFTKTSTDTYLVLTVAKMPLRLLKVTQLTVMVSFWWGKSSVTSLSLKTSALKLFTEADLLYQLSLLNQIILFQLSLPTPPPTTTTDAAPQLLIPFLITTFESKRLYDIYLTRAKWVILRLVSSVPLPLRAVKKPITC